LDFSIITVNNQQHGKPERHHEILEELVAAEELGFDCYWFTEHHFEEYGRPCPELMAATALAMTKTINIGIACIVLPWHHPIDVAEQIATLDLLGQGRMRIALGRGNQPHEFAGYGVDPGESKARFEESYTIIKGLLENDTFSYEGQFWQIPEVRLVPKPYTTPSPAFWQPAVSDSTIRGIAAKGINGLIGPYLTPGEVLKESYFDVWHEAKAAAGRPQLRMAHNEFVHLAETDEQAYKEAEEPTIWYCRKAASIWGSQDPNNAPKGYEYLVPILKRFQELTFDEIVADLSIIGSPETAIQKIKFFDECGVDELMLFAGMGPQMTHDKLMRSFELFGKYVIPEFKAGITEKELVA
jgi:alkanesulfonate monooxygenase SsuD/methylene tetrahydromethanopterin reductase-like flavin-dependent oxidoreductase (luciferase family)